ncbi:MAG: putative oxidoreductase [Actinomycetia bacterium]|nr:putative oxidoreductase [Actinomycetes bacterium]
MRSASGFELSETDRLLSTTRAVRKRLDLERPVDRQVVLECLRLAAQAPTGGNRQPWRWLVIDDPATKAGLAELYRRSFGPYMDQQRAAVAARGGDPDNAIIGSSQYLADHLEQVPVFVIPCLLERVEGMPAAELAGYYGSILPAVWSFMLALRSRGLGSAYTTLHLVYEREAAALLGVPDTVTQMALIPVAHTSGDFKPADRKPVEDVVYWNGWGQR